jgi:hypothetical protein
MQLLLMSEQQVSPRKAPGALCALKRLFLCVRAFVSLQMLQSREAPVAGSAYVRPRLVRLGGRKRRGDGGRGRRRLRGLDRRCNQSVTTPLSNISRSNLLLLLLALAESSLIQDRLQLERPSCTVFPGFRRRVVLAQAWGGWVELGVARRPRQLGE